MQIEDNDVIIQHIIEKHNLQNKNFLSPKEAARLLDWSVFTIYRRLEDGSIKHLPHKPKEDYKIHTKALIIDFLL